METIKLLNIFLSLAITLFFETGVYMILKHHDLKLLLIVSLMNIFLNGAMNLILTYLVNDSITYWWVLTIFEVGTVLVETLIIFLFMRFNFFKILLFAFIANMSSFLVGFLINNWIHDLTLFIVLLIIFALGYLFIYFFDIFWNIKHPNHKNNQ